jgi:hypothetical protein
VRAPENGFTPAREPVSPGESNQIFAQSFLTLSKANMLVIASPGCTVSCQSLISQLVCSATLLTFCGVAERFNGSVIISKNWSRERELKPQRNKSLTRSSRTEGRTTAQQLVPGLQPRSARQLCRLRAPYRARWLVYRRECVLLARCRE